MGVTAYSPPLAVGTRLLLREFVCVFCCAGVIPTSGGKYAKVEPIWALSCESGSGPCESEELSEMDLILRKLRK